MIQDELHASVIRVRQEAIGPRRALHPVQVQKTALKVRDMLEVPLPVRKLGLRYPTIFGQVHLRELLMKSPRIDPLLIPLAVSRLRDQTDQRVAGTMVQEGVKEPVSVELSSFCYQFFVGGGQYRPEEVLFQ